MDCLAACLIALMTIVLPAIALGASPETGHYAPNANFDAAGHFVPGAVGFNISDVSKVRELDLLPDGVSGLVWVGRCGGADPEFVAAVTPFLHNSKVFGFYLMDDPDPSWLRGRRCPPAHLMAEADWIHAHAPAAKTFVMLMNLGTALKPSYANSYNLANSHVDLFGVSPYPCRTEAGTCDFDMIRRFVDAALAAGIPKQRIVPTYQTFGGGNWLDDAGGRYVVPSDRHEQEIIARWATLIDRPVFDYAYSWGSQRGDRALENSPDLQALFASHNGVAVSCPGGKAAACGAMPPGHAPQAKN